jgi:hypothetical protein
MSPPAVQVAPTLDLLSFSSLEFLLPNNGLNKPLLVIPAQSSLRWDDGLFRGATCDELLT